MLQKIKANLDTFFIVVLLVVSIPLRFVNLSYSDYIGDEHKSFIQYDSDSSLKEFLLTRRKGPMQFLVSEIPHFITNDFTNELAERIPYAIISVATVILFYKLIDKFTNNKWVSFVAAFLYSVNGFIIGFGRIAQYQNLNLFFSFAAIYFYLDLIKNKHTNTQFLVRTLAGTLMLSISALSHWDVVFAVPIIAVIFIKFLLNKDFTVKYKLVLLISNVLFGCLLLLPFLIPYIEVQKTTPDNLRYLYRRLDVGYFIPDRYRLLIELYNPFITFWILLAGTVGSLFWFKKSYPFIIWFAVNYGIFEIFVRKPGTHIYNFLIPAFILVGFTVVGMVKRLKAMWRYIFVAVMSIIFTFFVYQSYMIFVDHTIEYPWDEETLLTFVCKDLKDRKGQFTKCGQFLRDNFETPPYTIDEKLPIFGFPHRRDWNKISEIVSKDMDENDTHIYGFTTNELKTIAKWYMEPDYKLVRGAYIIGVKRPQSFSDDWQVLYIDNKILLDELYRGDELVVKIWRVDNMPEIYSK